MEEGVEISYPSASVDELKAPTSAIFLAENCRNAENCRKSLTKILTEESSCATMYNAAVWWRCRIFLRRNKMKKDRLLLGTLAAFLCLTSGVHASSAYNYDQTLQESKEYLAREREEVKKVMKLDSSEILDPEKSTERLILTLRGRDVTLTGNSLETCRFYTGLEEKDLLAYAANAIVACQSWNKWLMPDLDGAFFKFIIDVCKSNKVTQPENCKGDWSDITQKALKNAKSLYKYWIMHRSPETFQTSSTSSATAYMTSKHQQRQDRASEKGIQMSNDTDEVGDYYELASELSSDPALSTGETVPGTLEYEAAHNILLKKCKRQMKSLKKLLDSYNELAEKLMRPDEKSAQNGEIYQLKRQLEYLNRDINTAKKNIDLYKNQTYEESDDYKD